jgi:hypothetical protein
MIIQPRQKRDDEPNQEIIDQEKEGQPSTNRVLILEII